MKKQFGEFVKILVQAHKQLQTADNTIEQIVGVRTRQINKAQRGVEVLIDTNEQLLVDSVDSEDDDNDENI